MRVLLIGGNGMLGNDIAQALESEDVARPSSQELDVLDAESLRAGCRRVRPEIIVSTMAFHRVDDAETSVAEAFRMNAVATRHLAVAAREFDACFAWVSTDYVFDGRASKPYEASDPAYPINVYGTSKAAGECLARMTTPEHLVVRTSGLYGLHRSGTARTNFADTILRLARSGREEITVVDDQVCSPTYTADFATTFAEMLRRGVRGTHHLTNSDECSWAEFAEAIVGFTGFPTRIRRVSTAEYAAAARRPAYSVLGMSSYAALGLTPPRSWREALPEFLRARIASGDAVS